MSDRPASYKCLWGLFAFVVLASFAVLGGFGFRIASEAPPIPEKVIVGDKVLFDGDLIRKGQNVWQSLGGQEIGTVWEQQLPHRVRDLAAFVEETASNRETLERQLSFAIKTAPKLTIQGGTTEVLRGIIARGLGLR